jgi:hypothetical protein
VPPDLLREAGGDGYFSLRRELLAALRFAVGACRMVRQAQTEYEVGTLPQRVQEFAYVARRYIRPV